jgi:hypothetical protein
MTTAKKAGLIELPEGAKARTTPSGEVAVIDVIGAATETKEPKKIWLRLSKTHPEVGTFCPLFQFPGQRQRLTPVVSKEGFARLIMLHNGDDFRGRIRAVLHGYTEIEDEEGGVLYVDTDSIVIAVPDKEGGK